MKISEEERVALYNHNMSILDRQLKNGFVPNYPTTSLTLSKGTQRIDYIIGQNKLIKRCV